MPVLIVYGMPEELKDAKALEQLVFETLPNAVSSIAELGITPKQVTTFIQHDLVTKGLGEEIIVFIQGLLRKPERTVAVRQRLVATVCETIFGFATQQLPQCRLIEVFQDELSTDWKGVWHAA